MPEFRKKPVVIEAVQFDPAKEWPSCVIPWGNHRATALNSPGYIETLEGKMAVIAGDWIIKGIRGEFYPCKNDIFLEIYEPLE